MGRREKTLDQILRGGSDQNIAFDDLATLLLSLGFEKRIKGSQHVFSREGVEEIVALQPVSGKAKAYQEKQARLIIVKYKLSGE